MYGFCPGGSPGQKVCVRLRMSAVKLKQKPNLSSGWKPAARLFLHEVGDGLLEPIDGQLEHGKYLADNGNGAGVIPHGSRYRV